MIEGSLGERVRRPPWPGATLGVDEIIRKDVESLLTVRWLRALIEAE